MWCVRSPIAASPKENKDRKWISGKDSAAAEHQSSIIGQMKTEQPNKRQTKQLVLIPLITILKELTEKKT